MKLSFEHISKLYGDTAALQQIDLTLGSGVYGLLGPNGAGKTTLMRIMTDLLAPSTGRVLLDGQDIAVMGAAFRKKLGYLPQDFGVYPNFTAEQFLLYIARLKGLSKFEAKRQTDDLLHMVGLEDKKQKKLKSFSGGQRQRVGIAQALLGDPEILVLDEPTAGLDPEERIRFRGIISDLSQQKLVLLSTHIVSGSRSSRKRNHSAPERCCPRNAKACFAAGAAERASLARYSSCCGRSGTHKAIYLQQCHAHRRKKCDPSAQQKRPSTRRSTNSTQYGGSVSILFRQMIVRLILAGSRVQ